MGWVINLDEKVLVIDKMAAKMDKQLRKGKRRKSERMRFGLSLKLMHKEWIISCEVGGKLGRRGCRQSLNDYLFKEENDWRGRVSPPSTQCWVTESNASHLRLRGSKRRNTKV